MTAPRPAHAPQTLFPNLDGCLQVGGVALTRLAARVGRTPFYAYDRALLDARVAQLRAALPSALRLHYSIKANPMPALVQHMAALVDGLDVASAGELAVALDTGVAPEDVSFAGPGKLEAELVQAIAAGVCVNVESQREIDACARIGDALGIVPLVALRVNPGFELKSSGMRMGGGAKPFGIDEELVPQALRSAAALGLRLAGLHIFSGSQSLKAEAIIEAHAASIALARRLCGEAQVALPRLNMGAGLGIPYFPGDVALDLAPIGAALAVALDALAAASPETVCALEMGRYLVGEAGVYVARVIERKLSRGEVFLVTDGGLHHHLAASGNFGQVIRKNYPVVIGNRLDAVERERATVVGPLCTPLDMLAERAELARAEPGDLVVVFQSGAYGISASPAAFLGHPPAREVLV